MKRLALLIPDATLRTDLQRVARAAGYAVECPDPQVSVGVIAALGVDVAVLDVAGPRDLERLAGLHQAAPALSLVALASDLGSETAVRLRRAGAQELLRKPFDIAALEQALAAAAPADAHDDSQRFLTREPHVIRLLEKVERAAVTDATIRIRGESGTGKDLLAQWIHRRSLRRANPFVVVSCAGLSEQLAESELFGHEPGAFTGAIDSRPGQVRASSGGTLVLDEISELGLTLQPKLLRVLQEREVTSIGSSAPEPVDLRVIATTQRDLSEEVERGRFREDLFYRLDVIEFEIPPLRERRDDIELLASAMLRSFAHGEGIDPPNLGAEALEILTAHPFRGNVRELSNLMRRATILFAGQEVDAGVLLSQSPTRPLPSTRIASLNLRDIERDAIARALVARDGNRTQAAKALGINVRTLRNKIRLYGLADLATRERADPSGWVSA